MYLDTLDLGQSVLNLDEALQTIKPGEETEIFQMIIKGPLGEEAEFSKRQGTSQFNTTRKLSSA